MEKNNNNRENELRSKLNKHLTQLTGIETDYYSALKFKDILQLKTVLSDINNLLTYKLALLAGAWIAEYFSLDEIYKKSIIKNIDSSNPNAMGFDIVINEPIKIIAEVKCNVPVKGGSKFGAMQSKKLIEDVQKLFSGKRQLPDTTKYLKFLFIINLGESSQEAAMKLTRKTKIFKENDERINRNITRDNMIIMGNEHPTELQTDKVYLKILKF